VNSSFLIVIALSANNGITDIHILSVCFYDMIADYSVAPVAMHNSHINRRFGYNITQNGVVAGDAKNNNSRAAPVDIIVFDDVVFARC
jgi:hypothetical protein